MKNYDLLCCRKALLWPFQPLSLFYFPSSSCSSIHKSSLLVQWLEVPDLRPRPRPTLGNAEVGSLAGEKMVWFERGDKEEISRRREKEAAG